MEKPLRYIGLDIHKNYMVAVGVDQEQNHLFNPKRVTWEQFPEWAASYLFKDDAVVIEMTTNTWEVYDLLEPLVHSVTVVHPPSVALIIRSQVKTDKKAALTLAQLHAAGLLVGIWVPDQHTRDIRSLVALRSKMVGLATQAKNRLHAILHRHHYKAVETPFSPDQREWWLSLPVTPLEKVRIQTDLDTLEYARAQQEKINEILAAEAGKDSRVPLLVQLPGIGVTNAMAILGAIGEIERFSDPKKLVGYAGLGAKVNDSGERRTTGGITKYGRRDLRSAMVEATNCAVRTSDYWKEVYNNLRVRMPRPKALVAVARKLLVVVWHVLTKEELAYSADPQQVARMFYGFAARVRVRNLPDGMSAIEFTRYNLERLGIADQVESFRWGARTVKLPPKPLTEKG